MAFLDAAYATGIKTRRSVAGIAVLFGSAAITYKSNLNSEQNSSLSRRISRASRSRSRDQIRSDVVRAYNRVYSSHLLCALGLINRSDRDVLVTW